MAAAGVADGRVEGSADAAASVEDSGFSLISCEKDKQRCNACESDKVHQKKLVSFSHCGRGGCCYCCSCCRRPLFERIGGNIQIVIFARGGVQITLAVDIVIHTSRGVDVPRAVRILNEARRHTEGRSDAVAFRIERSQVCAETP